jgi:proteasome accessory factor A
VAIRKVCGLETEYGIQLRGGGESNPIAASSVLINAYVALMQRRIGWDFEDESPGRDARGFTADGAMPPDVETHLVNTVLTNGARYYVDHAHPEVSTPECADALEVVRWDRAAERIVQRSMQAARSALPTGAEIVLHKNNSDGKGNSYGCHENYLLAREVPFGRIVALITPHFVTRQVFCGSGKVGTEAPGVSSADVPFQLSQRADFFEEEVGLETTLKRPIVNTRDEPHCDSQKYRRLHVIVGDANLAEVSTFLKVGTTAVVLSMIEDDAVPGDLALANPVGAIKEVSWDRSLRRPILLKDGRRLTALELQWQLLEHAQKYERERGLDSVGDEVGTEILSRWEDVLTGLEDDRASVAGQVDWVAKEQLLEGYMARHGIDWTDPRMRMLDLQYHDMRPERSLFARVAAERLVDDDAVETAMTEPPETTRAYFRGKCLQKWPEDIVAANWDSLVFDVGADPLRRVPMMEPLRGTAAHVASLITECTTAAELLDRLGS